MDAAKTQCFREGCERPVVEGELECSRHKQRGASKDKLAWRKKHAEEVRAAQQPQTAAESRIAREGAHWDRWFAITSGAVKP